MIYDCRLEFLSFFQNRPKTKGGPIPVFSNRSDTSTILDDIWHFFDIDIDTDIVTLSSKTFLMLSPTL